MSLSQLFGRQHRDLVEEYAEVLRICLKPSNAFRVISSCWLNDDQWKRYRETLIETRFLQKVVIPQGGTLYWTTKRGAQFLEAYEKVVECFQQ